MSTTYTDLTETKFPNAVDDLSRMSDLASSDLTLVNQYYTYYNAGNLTAAAQLLADNPTLINKLFNAAKFNILRDALIALERFYLSDVQTYINSTKQSLQTEIGEVKSDFQAELDEFTALGEYNASTQYVKHNIVTKDGNGYICIDNVKGIAPGTTSGAGYWQKIVAKGDKGDSGIGLSFRGQYSSTVSYTKDDCVTDGVSIWAALKASTGQALAEGEYWTLVMQINRKSATATLTVAGWSGNSQTVNVTGVTADNDIIVSPVFSSYDNWSKYSVRASAQGAGTITFSCKTTPNAAISFNVLIFG